MRKNVCLIIGILLTALLVFSGIGLAADSGGHGSPAPAKDSGGYGAPAAPAKDSGGYGSPAPAKSSGGYGEAPAPAAKTAPAKKTATPAAKPAAGKKAGSTPAKPEAPASSAPAATTQEAAAPVVEPTPAPVMEPAPMEPEFPAVTAGFVLSGILIGFAMGFVLQRGRFCMNSAFRDTIFIKDYTYMRAYILALIIAIIGANLLNDKGMIHLARQPFWWIADIVGGYVFGLGIVLAGGCGSGIWYRVGEGLMAAWVAVLGFFIGISAMSHGILTPVYKTLRGIRFEIADQGAPGLWHLVGDSDAVKWGVIAVVVVAGAIFVLAGKPFAFSKSKGYFWSVTGVLIGIIAVAAFWASEKFGGFSSGLTFTTPTRDIFLAITTGSSMAQPPFKMYGIGHVLMTWPVMFIIGVPIGAAVSAKLLKEFTWKTPPAKELLTVFGGSLMMGLGAQLCGGCNMGQGITGVASLSIGSIVATISIILGNWTMVYFKFIKPMQDMDLE